MSILTRPMEELLSYLLTRLHGGFLLQDLNHRNFHTNVSEGIYTLKDIKLNPVAINQNLSESNLHIFSSSISRITLQVPNVFRFLEDPLNIQAHHIIIDLCSASESGCSVIREDKTQVVAGEEEGQGISVLTKSIGNFLSKISFQATLVQIRIRTKPSDSTFIQLTIPKISFIESKSDKETLSKVMKIEGLRLNLLNKESEIYDPHDFSNLVILEEPIVIELSISKEMLFINCIISKLCMLLSLEQLKTIVKIFSTLQVSGQVDKGKVSVLTETLSALGEDIKESLPKIVFIRDKIVKVHLTSAVLCMTLEEVQPFSKKWSYFEGAYPGVPTSHIVLQANQVKASHSNKTSLKISKLSANHYNYLQAAALDTSELFATARQSYFNEFFSKRPAGQFWEPDLNKCHFCIGNILQIRRSNTDFIFMQPPYFRPVNSDIKLVISEGQIQITTGGIEIHTNQALLKFIEGIMSVNPAPPSKISKNLSASIPILRVDYQEYFGKCFCQGQEWTTFGEFFLINIQNKQDESTLNITTSKFELTMLADDILSNILTCSNIKISRLIKESVNNELLQERKETGLETYYEPKQGTISIKKSIEYQPYSMKNEAKIRKKAKDVSLVEEEFALAKAICLITVDVNEVVVKLEPNIIQRLVKILPVDKEDKDPWALATVVKVSYFNVELIEREKGEGKNMAACLFSYYSLDASVSRTVTAVADTAVSIISCSFSDVKALLMQNCMKSNHKYTKISVKSTDSYANHQELFYSLNESPIELTISNAENEETSIKLSNLVISLETLLSYSTFLSTFQIDLPKSKARVDKKRINLENLFFDLLNQDKRVLSVLHSGSIELMSIDTNSLALNGLLSNLEFYFLEDVARAHPLFKVQNPDLSQLLIEEGYVPLATLDSLQVYLTLIKPSLTFERPPGNSFTDQAHSCILGFAACQKLFEPFYLAKEVRNLALVNKLIDLQVNVGSLFFHLYPGTNEFLSKFIDFKDLKKEENEQEEEKKENLQDSGRESEEIADCRTTGVLINPQVPGKATSINLQDYLNPNKLPKELKSSRPEKKLQEVMSKFPVIHCHPEVCDSQKLNKNLNSTHKLDPSHGFPSFRLQGTMFMIVVNIYSKTPHPRCPNKNTLSQISIISDSTCISFCKFPQELHYSWRLVLSVTDVKVQDLIIGSSVKYIVKKDLNFKGNHNACSSFLGKIEVAAVWPRPDLKSDTELIVKIFLAPLKVSIDQHLVDFSLDLLNWKPEEQVLMQQTGVLPGQSEKVKPRGQEFYVQKLSIENVHINIDYIPHNIDSRHPGGIILNLFEIKDFLINLPKIDLKGVKNFETAASQTWTWWVEHVKDKELYKIIGNIGPFSYFRNAKNALVDIVKGQSGPDATKRALVGLVRSVTVEGINVVDSVVNGLCFVFKGKKRSANSYK